MARNYPRFLYADPKNTKNEGPFIVHTLHPRCILKVVLTPKTFDVILLESFEDDATHQELNAIIFPALKWLTNQMEIGAIPEPSIWK